MPRIRKLSAHANIGEASLYGRIMLIVEFYCRELRAIFFPISNTDFDLHLTMFPRRGHRGTMYYAHCGRLEQRYCVNRTYVEP